MEKFTNDLIDFKDLPRFEEVVFTKLHPAYWTILWINWAVVFLVLGSVAFSGVFLDKELMAVRPRLYFLMPLIFILWLGFMRLGFVKKGFAFRQHDVLFRHGVIATKTVIIPYNRIQHVSLHEGLLSRYFGLAKIEIFTAGGSSSDIEIPGILKAEAENIKQLLMVKIQKEL